MDFKQYKTLRIVIAFILGAMMSQAIILDNFFLAVFSVAFAMTIILIARRQVKEVIADERDYQIAGKAARYAMSAFSVVSVFVMFFLIFWPQQNPVYDAIANTLAYSVCSLLLLNSAIFIFLNKHHEKQD